MVTGHISLPLRKQGSYQRFLQDGQFIPIVYPCHFHDGPVLRWLFFRVQTKDSTSDLSRLMGKEKEKCTSQQKKKLKSFKVRSKAIFRTVLLKMNERMKNIILQNAFRALKHCASFTVYIFCCNFSISLRIVHPELLNIISSTLLLT